MTGPVSVSRAVEIGREQASPAPDGTDPVAFYLWMVQEARRRLSCSLDEAEALVGDVVESGSNGGEG